MCDIFIYLLFKSDLYYDDYEGKVKIDYLYLIFILKVMEGV